MKVVYRRLPVAIHKKLYDKCYSGVLCLMCGDVELSDYVFTCRSETAVHADILLGGTTLWKSLLVGCSLVSSPMLHTLLVGCHDSGVEWVDEATVHFKDRNRAFLVVADFVQHLAEKHWCVDMECCGLVCALEISVGLSADSIKHLSSGIVCLFGINETFAISFGLYKTSLFFSGICNSVKVYIDV
ncbi:hypothetical protein G9A89_022443 [Geosiphon pyriformis]|nr:hypothetical protein G9A89_022443 [Geosiphon pyriformis]